MALSKSPEPRSSLLLRRSKKWGINHLKALKVTEWLNAPAVELVDAAYLPTDKDEVFRQLTGEITQPTEADLEDFRNHARFCRHPLRPLFCAISKASWPDHAEAECSKGILWHFVDYLTYPAGMKRTYLTWTYGRRWTLTIQPGGIKCRIKCEGFIHPVDSTRPITTLLAWDQDCNVNSAAQQTLQILGQGIAAYNQDPGRDEYRGFVVCVQGTCLQLATATLCNSYLKELCQNRPLSEGLHLRRSRQFDLRKPVQRVEALQLVIGLLKLLEDSGAT